MTRYLAFALFLLAASPVEAAVRNYFAPELDGTRLDACLTAMTACGKPAADAFCKAQGFTEALIFQREAGVSTKRLDSGETCEGGNCIAFKQIKCFSPGDTAAAGQN
ncbi:MAG: hypothetical protein ACT4SY_11545 [Hyphomicrobiales bacterium]